jgi:hypothetical protein
MCVLCTFSSKTVKRAGWSLLLGCWVTFVHFWQHVLFAWTAAGRFRTAIDLTLHVFQPSVGSSFIPLAVLTRLLVCMQLLWRAIASPAHQRVPGPFGYHLGSGRSLGKG